ncbi:MAG: glycosyltransferase family 4 protein [Cyclobacteriaceae bacterium]|nr:glycosyltransferase family 4 protein [Cyclobacteriaceae bacterium]
MQKNNRTILLLCPYPHGHAPSQRFRFEQYLDALRQRNFEIDFRSFLSESGWRILYTRGNVFQKTAALAAGFLRRLGLLFRAIPRADLVFIHREASPIGPPLLEFIIAKVFRKRIIYDFDDAIWLPNTSEENALAAMVKWHSKVGLICRWSERVSVGNEYLGAYASKYNPQVIINPTTVDTARTRQPISVKVSKKRVTIGWTGSHSTLRYLQLIEPVLLALEREFPERLDFLFIADRAPSLQLKNMTFAPWSEETEIADLARIDIGIMPLEDDAWAKGKCGLKALQYMAMAIPTVASPVGVNLQIIDHGTNGCLCDSLESWTSHLRALIIDSSLRKRMGEAGEKKVGTSYSTVSNTSLFLSLFE